MSVVDWIIMAGTLLFIVLYGAWKTRKSQNIQGYLLGGNEANWITVGLSVMATQASAITFLSATGMGFSSGMEFVQFYLGMPIALIILSITIIPLFYKLKVYTAYEFLESRFDLKTRLFTAFLFLLQRSFAAGLTIYAPSIILTNVLGWNLYITNIAVGMLVIIYTVSGGTKAVSLTQKWQMGIIMGGMFIAFGILVHYISQHLSFGEAVSFAGKMGHMNIINFDFDVNSRYNVWAAFTGGIFLFMSYFGTDQSQVQRYISGKNITEGRLGMMFNAVLKIPMQFFIVFTGVMVFVFYQFESQPVYFDSAVVEQLQSTNNKEASTQFYEIKAEHTTLEQEKQLLLQKYKTIDNDKITAKIRKNIKTQDSLHKEVRLLAKSIDISVDSKETDHVFISFVLDYLPVGLVGLLIAVIFSAAMSSTAGELNALSSTLTVDFYKRIVKKQADEKHYLQRSRLFTLFWGLVAIGFTFVFSLADNLIEAVNIIGSIFYGVILGVFLLAFYVKYIKGATAFWAALLAQCIVFVIYYVYIYRIENPNEQLGYLWLNFIGCALVVGISLLIQWGKYNLKPS
ncbi:MAG: sodium:solute symporter [Flavobacteriales bacterium]